MSLSQKLSSPMRMFGKGLSVRQSITVEETNALDRDGCIQRISHSRVFRKDVGSLPLKNLGPDSVPKTITFDAFTEVKHICDGSNSNLFTCNWEGREVIVKRLKVEKIIVPHVLSEFEFESEFLRRAKDCPQLVKIWGYGFDLISEWDLPEDVPFDPESQLSVTNDKGRHIQMPFVVLEALKGGSLGFFLNKRRNYHKLPFSIGRVLSIMRQLAEALTYIHEGFHKDYCIIHRDLKPDNIVFDDHNNLRVIDFGLSTCVARGTGGVDAAPMTGGTGSLRYMSPEVAKSTPYNDRTDMYSFGIIAYEVLTGVAPYGSMNKAKFFERVIEKKERPDVNIDDYGRRIHAPKAAKDLISRCWDDNYTKRPSASEALAVCWELEKEQALVDAQQRGCSCS